MLAKQNKTIDEWYAYENHWKSLFTGNYIVMFNTVQKSKNKIKKSPKCHPKQTTVQKFWGR